VEKTNPYRKQIIGITDVTDHDDGDDHQLLRNDRLWKKLSSPYPVLG
jgi:hypothetical protein